MNWWKAIRDEIKFQKECREEEKRNPPKRVDKSGRPGTYAAVSMVVYVLCLGNRWLYEKIWPGVKARIRADFKKEDEESR